MAGVQPSRPISVARHPQSAASGARIGYIKYLGWVSVALAAWFAVYESLAPASRWLTYGLLRLAPGRHLSAAVEFFVFEVPKVLMLLVLVVFGVGIVRSFFTPERTRRMLAGKRESVGNVLAALLGVVTPFCSCSAVPLFIGFVTTGVPLGVTFSFLISAPMVNEIALVLLFGLFGWKVAAIYHGHRPGHRLGGGLGHGPAALGALRRGLGLPDQRRRRRVGRDR